MLVGERQFPITASIGATLGNENDRRRRSCAMPATRSRKPRKTVGDRITVFDDSAKARVRRRRNLATALRRGALANNELRLEYQPILELAHLRSPGSSRCCAGTTRQLGPIGPDEFIPIAEATGLIHPIGEWVFEQALQQLAMWHADVRVRADVWLAINLSAQQLGHRDLIARIGDAVRASGVPPELVHFEITESVLMDRVDNAMQPRSARSASSACA